MKNVDVQKDDTVIRSNFRSLLIRGGISEDLASKLVDPSGLTLEDIKTIEQSEQGKMIREQTPALQRSFLEYMVKHQAYTKLGQELFIKLVASGVPVRRAIEETGFQMTEDDIKRLEKDFN